ncbi:hypothetical protein ACH4ZX_40280 [Streptomyces sp. NPDC020490]|uniref:hypothetical protein n=1 Tax=Streptomyces sp. NPDC020490 TaxID=3365078 RepID=UPI00378AC17B
MVIVIRTSKAFKLLATSIMAGGLFAAVITPASAGEYTGARDVPAWSAGYAYWSCPDGKVPVNPEFTHSDYVTYRNPVVRPDKVLRVDVFNDSRTQTGAIVATYDCVPPDIIDVRGPSGDTATPGKKAQATAACPSTHPYVIEAKVELYESRGAISAYEVSKNAAKVTSAAVVDYPGTVTVDHLNTSEMKANSMFNIDTYGQVELKCSTIDMTIGSAPDKFQITDVMKINEENLWGAGKAEARVFCPPQYRGIISSTADVQQGIGWTSQLDRATDPDSATFYFVDHRSGDWMDSVDAIVTCGG